MIANHNARRYPNHIFGFFLFHFYFVIPRNNFEYVMDGNICVTSSASYSSAL